MIQLCINTLTSDSITPEEEALGYFTRKKLQQLSTWEEQKEDENKHIDQFVFQTMFEKPQDPNGVPNGSIILQYHWQYAVKRSGVR